MRGGDGQEAATRVCGDFAGDLGALGLADLGFVQGQADGAVYSRR
jgi:hypothetical protein